jgi:hypothetical protein
MKLTKFESLISFIIILGFTINTFTNDNLRFVNTSGILYCLYYIICIIIKYYHKKK